MRRVAFDNPPDPFFVARIDTKGDVGKQYQSILLKILLLKLQMRKLERRFAQV